MNIRSFTAISFVLATLGLGACSSNITLDKTEVYYSKERNTSFVILYKGHNLAKDQDFQMYHHIVDMHRVALWQKNYKRVFEEIKSDRHCIMFVSYTAGEATEKVKSFNCSERNNGDSFRAALEQLS